VQNVRKKKHRQEEKPLQRNPRKMQEAAARKAEKTKTVPVREIMRNVQMSAIMSGMTAERVVAEEITEIAATEIRITEIQITEIQEAGKEEETADAITIPDRQ
jgi:hypothetical protein